MILITSSYIGYVKTMKKRKIATTEGLAVDERCFFLKLHPHRQAFPDESLFSALQTRRRGGKGMAPGTH